MSKYNFNQDISTKNFSILIDTEAEYGYFEDNELGDENAGGLWFNNKVLEDYDGVWELPTEVSNALAKHGYILED